MKVRRGWIPTLALLITFAAGTGEVLGSSGSNCGAEIFGSIIDRQIAFYEGRTYLSASGFRILAEIGRDAEEKVRWLRRHKTALVAEMMNNGVKRNASKVRIYLQLRDRVGGEIAGISPFRQGTPR